MASTNLHLGAPAVVAEALSLGLRVIDNDTGGMCDYVDEACGGCIALTAAPDLVERVRVASHAVLDEPAKIAERSAGTLEREKRFSSEAQIPRITDLYVPAQSAYRSDAVA